MKETLEKTFEEKALAQALFYEHEERLRFELFEKGSSIKKFMTAFGKATEIINFQFSEAERVSICLTFYGSKCAAGRIRLQMPKGSVFDWHSQTDQGTEKKREGQKPGENFRFSDEVNGNEYHGHSPGKGGILPPE